MDLEEYWDSRVMGFKHGDYYHHFPPARLDSSDVCLALGNLDGDDNYSQACLPCPYCYMDVEISFLCTHLQEEHCFDMKNAVCPICAENLGRDMTAHFMIQHSHLIKSRKPKKSRLWANSTPVMGRDLQELTYFLGVRSTNNREDASDPALDSLLSPFISCISLQTEKADQETNSNSPSGSASTTSDVNSTLVAKIEKDQDQCTQKKIERAEFVEQLLLSTIF